MYEEKNPETVWLQAFSVEHFMTISALFGIY
jgi:hypothetical protein